MDKQKSLYLAPKADVIVLQGREQILNLSNYGGDNAPGQGLGGGTDYGIF